MTLELAVGDATDLQFDSVHPASARCGVSGLEWDPDRSVSRPGRVPLRFVAADLVEQGLLEATEAEQMISQFEQSARDGRFFVTLTMFAALGVKPA